MSGLRVGGVSYLNACPLLEGMSAHLLESRLSLDHPSRLAEQLARGELDLGLIPSIEYFRLPRDGFRVVPGVSISARGPVHSVKLFCRVPLGEIGRLALDDSSRTSQALARVWLSEAHGVRPEVMETLRIGESPLESTADAVLLIGDKAMRVPTHSFSIVVDLSEAWLAMTGLPFVFALWVVRAEAASAGLAESLGACRDAGLRAAARLAAEHGPRLGWDEAAAHDYLTRVLCYDLGEDQVAGLLAFRDRAARFGLVSEGAPLAFLECRSDFATRG